MYIHVTMVTAHADAAASDSLKLCYISVLICYVFHLYYWHVLPMEAHITYDRNTLINIGKGSTGFGLRLADLETITAHNIF